MRVVRGEGECWSRILGASALAFVAFTPASLVFLITLSRMYTNKLIGCADIFCRVKKNCLGAAALSNVRHASRLMNVNVINSMLLKPV